MRKTLLAFLLFPLGNFAAQQPFSYEYDDVEDTEGEFYKLKWPVHRVAIIGAGPGGIMAYREFINSGFDVHMFDRDNVAGGNWHYTEETPLDAPIPNPDVSVGDFTPSLPPDGVILPYSEEYIDGEGGISYPDRRREHRGPKPVWESLKSNAPSPWQQIPEHPWPVGTPWELTQNMLQRYMRSFASFHGVGSDDENPNVSYNTRVELVEKYFDDEGNEHGWTLTLKKLERISANVSKATWWTERFDAVTVATGRFNAPSIPNIPGLSEWADKFPGRILHSRQYRRPEAWANETILVVGAATSGGEISRDLNPFAKKIYQSIRPDNATVPHFRLRNFLRRLPENTTVIPEVKRFHPSTDITSGKVELKNGTIITGVDRIIFATGFRYSFPFLPQYHNSSIGLNETAPAGQPQPLVTDGTHIRSLHWDLFYIEEPTIGFINMNLGLQSFTYAEYLSLALAKVWGNKARLPPTSEQWRFYQKRVKEYGGYGKHFQFLGVTRAEANTRFFVGFLNRAAVIYGGRQIDQVSKANDEIRILWSLARFGDDVFSGEPDNATAHFARGWSGNSVEAQGNLKAQRLDMRSRNRVLDSIFNDLW